MAVQQGRSKRRGVAYSLPYVEPLSVARTPLADFFKSLLYFSPDCSPNISKIVHQLFEL